MISRQNNLTTTSINSLNLFRNHETGINYFSPQLMPPGYRISTDRKLYPLSSLTTLQTNEADPLTTNSQRVAQNHFLPEPSGKKERRSTKLLKQAVEEVRNLLRWKMIFFPALPGENSVGTVLEQCWKKRASARAEILILWRACYENQKVALKIVYFFHETAHSKMNQSRTKWLNKTDVSTRVDLSDKTGNSNGHNFLR